MSYIVGIDPGINGGIAYYCIETDDWSAEVLPVIESSKGRKELDLSTFVQKIVDRNEYIIEDGPNKGAWYDLITLAVVETPPIVPGNGVLAYRSLFKTFGEIRGVLAALGIRTEEPSPQLWKKTILAGTTKDKEAAISYVRKRLRGRFTLPKLGPKSKKYHDGIADAVCLAEYGRRLLASNTAGPE